jgi:phosphomannomutase
LLGYLGRKQQTLKQAVDALPHYISSPEIKLGCADDIKFDLISKRIAKELKKLYPKGKSLTIDGIRIDTKEEMVVVRASQNGPYITVKFEAKTQARYDALAAQIGKLLRKYKEIDFAKGVNIDAFEAKKG